MMVMMILMIMMTLFIVSPLVSSLNELQRIKTVFVNRQAPTFFIETVDKNELLLVSNDQYYTNVDNRPKMFVITEDRNRVVNESWALLVDEHNEMNISCYGLRPVVIKVEYIFVMHNETSKTKVNDTDVDLFVSTITIKWTNELRRIYKMITCRSAVPGDELKSYSSIFYVHRLKQDLETKEYNDDIRGHDTYEAYCHPPYLFSNTSLYHENQLLAYYEHIGDSKLADNVSLIYETNPFINGTENIDEKDYSNHPPRPAYWNANIIRQKLYVIDKLRKNVTYHEKYGFVFKYSDEWMAGRMVCKHERNGNVMANIVLNIFYYIDEVPKVTLTLNPLVQVKGAELSAECCMVFTRPLRNYYNVSWNFTTPDSKSETFTEDNSKTFYSKSNLRTCSNYVIKHVQFNSGIFKCYAYNIFSGFSYAGVDSKYIEIQNSTLKIELLTNTTIVLPPEENYLTVNLKLESNLTVKFYAWFKNGTRLKNATKLWEKVDKSPLVILNETSLNIGPLLQLDDITSVNGIYTYVVSNGGIEKLVNYSVNVGVAPKVQFLNIGNIELYEKNQEYTLECLSEPGYPEAPLTWLWIGCGEELLININYNEDEDGDGNGDGDGDGDGGISKCQKAKDYWWLHATDQKFFINAIQEGKVHKITFIANESGILQCSMENIWSDVYDMRVISVTSIAGGFVVHQNVVRPDNDPTPPEVNIPPETFLTVGGQVNLDCVLDPKLFDVRTALWYKIDSNEFSEILTNQPGKYCLNNFKENFLSTQTLTISNVTMEDAGTYRCVANIWKAKQKLSMDKKSSAFSGEKQKRDIQVSVSANAGPSFVIDLPLQTFILDEATTHRFFCSATGVPEPFIIWLHNGIILTHVGHLVEDSNKDNDINSDDDLNTYNYVIGYNNETDENDDDGSYNVGGNMNSSERINNNGLYSISLDTRQLVMDMRMLKNEDVVECLAMNRVKNISSSTNITINNVADQKAKLLANKSKLLLEFSLMVTFIVLLLILSIIVLCKWWCYKKRTKRTLEHLVELLLANQSEKRAKYNPDLPLDEQTEVLLYEPIKWEIDAHRIKFDKLIGSGAFGQVYKAKLLPTLGNPNVKSLTVAVKTVKNMGDEDQLRALISELKIMVHLGYHNNLLSVIGAVTKDLKCGYLYVVMEYCQHGNLKTFLQKYGKDLNRRQMKGVFSKGNNKSKEDTDENRKSKVERVEIVLNENLSTDTMFDVSNKREINFGKTDINDIKDNNSIKRDVSDKSNFNRYDQRVFATASDHKLSKSNNENNLKNNSNINKKDEDININNTIDVTNNRNVSSNSNNNDDETVEQRIESLLKVQQDNCLKKLQKNKSTCENNLKNTKFKHKNKNKYEDNGVSDDDDDDDEEQLTLVDLYSMALQVARGLEYLSFKKYIHRDIAARNVLVTSDRTMKLCDFGLAKDCYKMQEYKKKSSTPVPIKWMALESLSKNIYTLQSDVWSFGVLLWEIFTIGSNPYSGVMMDKTFVEHLLEGYRLEQPSLADKEIYNLMLSCWHNDPDLRPTAAQLVSSFNDIMLKKGQTSTYLDMRRTSSSISTSDNNGVTNKNLNSNYENDCAAIDYENDGAAIPYSVGYGKDSQTPSLSSFSLSFIPSTPSTSSQSPSFKVFTLTTNNVKNNLTKTGKDNLGTFPKNNKYDEDVRSTYLLPDGNGDHYYTTDNVKFINGQTSNNKHQQQLQHNPFCRFVAGSTTINNPLYAYNDGGDGNINNINDINNINNINNLNHKSRDIVNNNIENDSLKRVKNLNDNVTKEMMLHNILTMIDNEVVENELFTDNFSPSPDNRQFLNFDSNNENYITEIFGNSKGKFKEHVESENVSPDFISTTSAENDDYDNDENDAFLDIGNNGTYQTNRPKNAQTYNYDEYINSIDDGVNMTEDDATTGVMLKLSLVNDTNEECRTGLKQQKRFPREPKKSEESGIFSLKKKKKKKSFVDHVLVN